jgi:DNA-3-methyladenine glycosylase
VTRPLSRAWFARPSTAVAPDLLGRHLVRRLPDGTECRVRLVETEAYDMGDPASHSYRGPTRRTDVMFGPAGHLYVYLIYGMHHCLNVVTGANGHGAAVLLRAAEPLEGIAAMSANRGVADTRLICRGPARLAQALGVDRSFNGIDLLRSDVLWLEQGAAVETANVAVTRRIGISVAIERPWRYIEAGSPWASPTPAASRSPAARRRSR